MGEIYTLSSSHGNEFLPFILPAHLMAYGGMSPLKAQTDNTTGKWMKAPFKVEETSNSCCWPSSLQSGLSFYLSTLIHSPCHQIILHSVPSWNTSLVWEGEGSFQFKVKSQAWRATLIRMNRGPSLVSVGSPDPQTKAVPPHSAQRNFQNMASLVWKLTPTHL